MASSTERPMRPFFILWTGQALSLIGSQAVQFALIWWLTLETGSATILAMASLVGLVPPVACGPFAGALVDRWNRKLVMLVADAAVALASLGLAVMFFVEAANTTVVFVALAVRAIGGTFHQPAMVASTSLMVPKRHLTRIQGLNQMIQGGLLVVAAPLGGLLLASLEMGPIILVDCATALMAIVPLLFIHVPQPERQVADGTEAQESGAMRNLLRDVGDGFGYLRAHTGHLMIVLVAAATNMFVVPAFSLLPLRVSEQLGGSATHLAGINSAFGVGMFAGGILLGVWGGFRRRIITTFSGMAAFAGAILGVGLAPGVVACGIAMFAAGVFVPLVNGSMQAILQATVAADYQGRIFSLMGSLAGLTAPIGLVLAAPMAELLGVQAWYVASAVVCMLMAVTGFLTPAIMRIEDAEPEPGEPSARYKADVAPG